MYSSRRSFARDSLGASQATQGKKLVALIPCLILLAASVFGGSPGGISQSASDLTSLTLEQLMEIEVTTVSRKRQRLTHTTAAAYVITSDDIARSTANSVPELLREVPGLHVARIDANKWAISSRGFNSRFANKLLVLIDGRSIYSPVFSGVYWESMDLMLANIDRIEVIRGPGRRYGAQTPSMESSTSSRRKQVGPKVAWSISVPERSNEAQDRSAMGCS